MLQVRRICHIAAPISMERRAPFSLPTALQKSFGPSQVSSAIQAVNPRPYLKGEDPYLNEAQGTVRDANRLSEGRCYEKVLRCKFGSRKQGKDR